MKQLPLFLPFTSKQADAMLQALARQRWPRPDSWCHCDTCRRAREAEAVRQGQLSKSEKERIAASLWDMPGIYRSPDKVVVDYDAHEALHRAVWGIRWGK
jgi:hypothetical protein